MDNKYKNAKQSKKAKVYQLNYYIILNIMNIG